MSGAAGGSRITRTAVKQTVEDYTENILSKIEGFKDAKLSGSINRPEKDDFGDIDIIVTIETEDDKRVVKKAIVELFASLSDDELPPLRNPKYNGKKSINHGEMVTVLYPISDMPGEFVQIDNIIALSSDEGAFKKTILDYPAELQGIILGLVKTPLLEERPEEVFARMGIKDIPELGENKEYEFHIDTSGLTLRLVTYGANYKILDSNTVWQSKSFTDVKTLLKDFDLDGSFNAFIEQVKRLKNERSKNRVKGFFKRSIKVGAAEQGTSKGDVKQRALDTVAQIQESRALHTRARLTTKYLDEDSKSRIAVFPGAFKPPHKDHIARIKAASEKVGDDGKVLVIISPKPRTKDGQETIDANQTVAVFDLYKSKGTLPNNVIFKISDTNSPVGAAYAEFESDSTQPYIAVFGKDDKARFSSIEDNLPNVVIDSFEEAGVGNTSATDLRIAIANRDKEELVKLIAPGVTAEEYLDALGIEEVEEIEEEIEEEVEEERDEVLEEEILEEEEDEDRDTNPWDKHATMLNKMQKRPELLKGLWKSISKASRKALVLYFREKKQQETAAPVESIKEQSNTKNNVLNENSTYSKDIDYKLKIRELTEHMLEKGMNIKPLPKVTFKHSNSANARLFNGKTAYYEPATSTIVLYTEGRHPKDIVRSFAHEMMHHIQNLEGRLGSINTTNTKESEHLNDLEKEANLNGTMTFRNWTDSVTENLTTKIDTFLTENNIKLPPDQEVVLQAGTEDHERGLIVKWRSDGGYDVAYWYGTPDNIVSAELVGDGESFGDIKHVWLGYHPELDSEEKVYEESSGVDGEVVCRGCGWIWDLENGGEDPYLCHKCGYDNSPNIGEQHKTRDPFGLNQYARELAADLEESLDQDETTASKKKELKEGVFDTITNKVSSDVFNSWKQQFDEDNNVGKISFNEEYDLVDSKGRQLEFYLEAELELNQTEERVYSADGGADAGDEEEFDSKGTMKDPGLAGDINLNFTIDPRDLPKAWTTLSMDLKDIVRHEIEHLTQSGYNIIPSKSLPDDQEIRDRILIYKTLPEREYYTLDKEIPAMLQGMYFKAKKLKKSFKDVVKVYLDSRKVSQEDQEKIIKRWKPAAKKLNLPNL